MTSFYLFAFLFVSAAAGLAAGPGGHSNDLRAVPAVTPTPTAASPRFDTYRGVSIGSTIAQVNEKLGAPAQRSKAGDYYVISKNETIQFGYDSNGTVKSISATFTGDLKAAPAAKDVLGMDPKKEADGSINRMEQFPKDGYSVTYVRLGGSDAMVIVTIQRMARE